MKEFKNMARNARKMGRNQAFMNSKGAQVEKATLSSKILSGFCGKKSHRD